MKSRNQLYLLLICLNLVSCRSKVGETLEVQYRSDNDATWSGSSDQIRFADSVNLENLNTALKDSATCEHFIMAQFSRDIIPTDVFKLRKLTYLSIIFTSVTKIPREMCKLQHLQSLHLTRNALTNVDNIDCLPKLRDVHLMGNKLTILPEFKNLDSLIELDASLNDFSKGLDVDFPPSLEKVWLARCELRHFPKGLLKLSRLAELDLENNSQLTKIPASIAKLRSLRKLKLSGTGLTSNDVEELERSLPECNIIF